MAPAVRLCFAKTICLLSMIFLSIGPVALFYLGLTYVSQYRMTSHYVMAVCDLSNVTSYALCRKDCLNQSTNCTDVCLGVGNVKYETPLGGVVKGATLFDSLDAMNTIQSRKKQCHGEDCSSPEEEEGLDLDLNEGRSSGSGVDQDEADSEEDGSPTPEPLVTGIQLLQNSSRQTVTCYVNPDDTSSVLRNIPQGQVVMHMMLWPSVMVVLGFSFCLVSKLCTREKC